MSTRFNGPRAKNYLFRTPEGERAVIAIYAGPKKLGFIEYDTARRFVDQIHDLCDEHEQQLRKGVTDGRLAHSPPPSNEPEAVRRP